MFNSVRSCSTLFGAVQLCSEPFNSVRSRSTLFGAVQLCSELFNSVRSCSILFRAVQFCSELFSLIIIYYFIIYLPYASYFVVPVHTTKSFAINLFSNATAVVLLLPIMLLISSLVAPLLLIMNSIAFCSG